MESYILNKSFEKVGYVENYSSYIWTDRYSECGDFELTTTPTNPFLQEMQLGYYLTNSESESLMIIESIEIKQTKDDSYAKISGRSLESILYRRYIYWDYNNPSNLNALVISHIKDALSPGVGTDRDRDVSNFYLNERFPPGTPTLSALFYSFKGKSLYEAVKKAVDDMDIGFRIRLSSNNLLVFDFVRGDIRTRESSLPAVIYSAEFQNMTSMNYLTTMKDYKNYTKVDMAPNDFISKQYACAVLNNGRTPSGLDRFEGYSDGSKIKQQGYEDSWNEREAYSQGDRELALLNIKTLFEAEADTLKEPIYGVDYFLGDTVTLESGTGAVINARVTEFISSYSNNGITRYPTFAPV